MGDSTVITNVVFSTLRSLFESQHANLLQFIPQKYPCDFIIIGERDHPYSGAFYQNIDVDMLAVTNISVDQFHIFACGSVMSTQLLNILNMEHRIWMHHRECIFNVILSNSSFCLDIIDAICNLVVGPVSSAPPTIPITSQDLHTPQFKYMAVSDENNGMVTCSICTNWVWNDIILLCDWNMQWWINHVNSSMHQHNIAGLK